MNPYAPPVASIDAAGVPAGERGFKSAQGLAKAIVVLMGLNVVAELAGDANAFVTIGVMKRVIAEEVVDKAELTAIDARTGALAMLGLVLLVVAAVLFCLFMPRANRNARAFGSPMSITPGWAAGWFFVPFANLWKPYQAMKEIWQGSDPDPTVHPVLVPAPQLLRTWWGFYLLHNIGGQIVFQVSKGANQASELITTAQVEIFTSMISIVAAVLAAMVVRAVARRQDERQRRYPAGSPHPAPGVAVGPGAGLPAF